MAIDWFPPWCAVQDDAVAASLSAELLREIPPGHVLHGLSGIKALGYREDQDDVAFALPDGRVAVVHLTWSRREAIAPDHPTTEMIDSLEALKRVMQRQHEDWK